MDYTRGVNDFIIRRVDGSGFMTKLSVSEILPSGMCPYLAHTILPYIMTLGGGGRFPWMTDIEADAVDCQCPNPGGSVAVRANRAGESFRIDVIRVGGGCPKEYKTGDSFVWRGHFNLPFMDLNLLLSWLTRMQGRTQAARSPELRSTLGNSSFTIERECGGCGPTDRIPCPSSGSFSMSLGRHLHRCRYHKFPTRDHYDEGNWIPKGLCPELFHAAYPASLAEIYGAQEGLPIEIQCPNSGMVRVMVETRDRPLAGVRELVMRGLLKMGVNTEIPLKRCYLRVVQASDCPMAISAGTVFEFNMGEDRGICPAMFHNIHPALDLWLRGGEVPWQGLPGRGGILQCPDHVSAITMTIDGNGSDG